MAGEDQERFEDYLELEHYIEELQAGHVAHPPAELTTSQASIYRMAAFFRSATPEANQPRPAFAAELQARLEQELQQPPVVNPLPLADKEQRIEVDQKKPEKRRSVSRRRLLTGGAAVAASLAVGVGVGAAIDHTIGQTNTSPPASGDNYASALVGNGVPTIWHFVAPLVQLGDQAIRFTANAVVGYVIRDDSSNSAPVQDQIIAMSAACTHMGCIVQWQDSDRKFHCPCHGGLFTEYGKVDAAAAPLRYLRALPRLNTKVENGNIYVEVPGSKQ
ncbi:MAG: hypothetical protein NVS4B7_15640 [Ktedonobacteraceae bacterium]